MTDRPILFSAPMVRALLAGTKTQTRRIVKLPKDAGPHAEFHHIGPVGEAMFTDGSVVCNRYGRPGDRLWVRETWAVGHGYDGMPPRAVPVLPFLKRHYAATEERGGLLWRPSIHMPRWASRITLEITDVRVERLRDISEADAIAEGIEEVMTGRWRIYGRDTDGHDMDRSPRVSYCSLWDSINGAGSWEANPWVWVVSFKQIGRRTP